MTYAGISFEDLLRYEEAEAKKWHEWLSRNPGTLELPVSQEKNVRRLVLHLHAVGHRNIQRLLGEEQTPNEKFPQASLEDLFKIGRDTRAKARRFLMDTRAEELGRPRQFISASLGTFRATPRKILLHGFVHATRHWAQIAAALRAHGYDTGQHDVIFSEAIE